MRALPVRRAPEGTPEQDAQPPALSQRGAPPERAATRRDSGVSVAVPWRLREASCEGDATGQAWGSGDAPPPKRPRAMAGESAAAKRPRLPAAHGGGAGTDVKLGPGAVEVHGVGGRLAEALAEGDSNVFAVERILGERRRSGRAQFLIRWLGCAPAHPSPTPSPRLAHPSRIPRRASRASVRQSRPTDRGVLRGRFDASHDSWELEANVSEGLAAAFRKKGRREQYGTGELGPEPKRRQRDGESSHEAEEEGRPRSGAPFERKTFEPKTFLPDDVKEYLAKWCLDNIDSPYPNEREKHDICAATDLTLTQVSNWCVTCNAPTKSPRAT